MNYPIAWIDMDSIGHVNSSKYFTYLEMARIKYFENIGLLDYFKINNISAVIAKTECSYFIPLKYPDTIVVGARVKEQKDQYCFKMEYYVNSKTKGLAAIGEADINVFDFKSNKKIPIPTIMVDKIRKFEKNNNKQN